MKRTSRILTLALALALSLAAPVSAAGVADSGICGANLIWTLMSDGTLTISGSGAMEDYDSPYSATVPVPNNEPWHIYQRNIMAVAVGNGVTYIGEGAFQESVNLKSVTLPNSLENIGRAAFYKCSGLANVYIPEGVAAIGGMAFSDCSSLESISIPSSVTFIGEEAFSGCSCLKSVSIPPKVTGIGSWVFSGCSSLKSVNIPPSVVAIGGGAFAGCSGLESVSIPSSVTSIQLNAFLGCTGLSDIYYSGTEAQWKAIDTGDAIGIITDAAIHYNSTGPAATPPAPATKPTVVLSPQKLSVDGVTKAPELYNIDNTNFFKIRDLAELLNGTSAQFDVDYDAATNTVIVTTGVPYSAATGTVREAAQDKSDSAVVSPQGIQINGEKIDSITAYNIGNTNFFGLRALRPYLGYEVDFDAASNTAIITTK